MQEYRGYARTIATRTLPNGELEVKENITYQPNRYTSITIRNDGERYLTDDEIIDILNEDDRIENDAYPLKSIRRKALLG